MITFIRPPSAPVEVETPALPVYSYSNPAVTVDGVPSNVGASLHYSLDTQQVSMSADITGMSNEGPFIVQITLPHPVGLPVVRQSNGQPTSEEIYLLTTISNGRMTATGKLPSGAWEISAERVNTALRKINAPFNLSLPTVTFIVSRG